MVKTASNPQAMVSQMMQGNPNFKKIQELGKQFNGDYKEAFYSTAKQMGIDPDDFLNQMR